MWDIITEVLNWQSLLTVLILVILILGSGMFVDRLLDKRHVRFRKTVKVGDKIEFASQRYFEGDIVEMDTDGEHVIVKTRIHKNEIFDK